MPDFLQIAASIVVGLLLPPVLTGAGLSGFVPALVVALWALVIAGLLHRRGWTKIPAISSAIQQVPGLGSALDLLVDGAAPRILMSAVDRRLLKQSIEDRIKMSLLGQEKAAGELAANVQSALDPEARPDRPSLVVIAGGPGSGRSTMLECVRDSISTNAAATLHLALDSQQTYTADALAQYDVVLVDDTEQQSPETRTAIRELLKRPGPTRLVVLAYRDKQDVDDPLTQPTIDAGKVTDLLADIDRQFRHTASVIVPLVPDYADMERRAIELLKDQCNRHGLALDVEISREAIKAAIVTVPWHQEGRKAAAHPGLWMNNLKNECDRSLTQLAHAGCQRVKLILASKTLVQFERIV